MKIYFYLFVILSLLQVPKAFAQGSAYALSFSGQYNSSCVKINHATTLVSNNKITLEAWIMPTAYPPYAGMVFSKHETHWTREWDMMIIQDGSVRCTLYGEDNTAYNAFSNSTVALNKWTHLAFTYSPESGIMRIYINGVLDYSRTIGNIRIRRTDIKPLIGAYWEADQHPNVTRNHFSGRIDEVRLWFSERSNDQIREYMCKKLPATHQDLIAYYKLDEGSSTTTKDHSGKNHHGVLIKNPSWVISGAPIGDESVFAYQSNWQGKQLTITATPKENFNIKNITGSPSGIHLYRVDEAPNSRNGLQDVNRNFYTGTFIAGNTSTTYIASVSLDPSTSSCLEATPFFERNDNAELSWRRVNASINTENTALSTPSFSTRKEFIYDIRLRENNGSLGSAATIQAPSPLCAGHEYTFTIPAIENADSYSWILPQGASPVSGSSTTITNQISLRFDPQFTAGILQVKGLNACGSGEESPPYLIQLNPYPSPAASIQAPALLCAGSVHTFTVPPISGGDSYAWTLPPGSSPLSGTNITDSNQITLKFDLSFREGILNVTGINACGAGQKSPDQLIVLKSAPLKPLITYECNTLFSSSPTANQWYLNGRLIDGATDQQFITSESGSYTLVVSNTCGDAASTIDFESPGPLTIPNVFTPNQDRERKNETFVLSSTGIGAHVQIYNRWGSLVYESINYQNDWAGEGLANGTYYYYIVAKNACTSKPFVGWVTILR